MQSITEYVPLTEAVSTTGDKYYKSCSVEQFSKIQAEAETIYFDVSKTYCRSERVKEWRQADPDDVMVEWETQNLTKREKLILQSSLDRYLTANPTKKATKNVIITMIGRIKE